MENPIEVEALERRYVDARNRAQSRGALVKLMEFETAVKNKSQALINVWPAFLVSLLSNDKALYASYNLQVAAEVRWPANIDDDRQRQGVSGVLFGSYGQAIRYAALGLTMRGLTSWGSCCMAISAYTLNASATLLETNSYNFVRKHSIVPGDSIPNGFRATWATRHKLAVAKLGDQVKQNTSTDDFAHILLPAASQRATDEFVEIHIYGPFDHQAIEAVALPDTRNLTESERINVIRIQEMMQKENKIVTIL